MTDSPTPTPTRETRQIEFVAIEDLRPYAGNPRTHSPAQVAMIARSIQAFGWTVPVLLDGAGEVVAGHGRILAAEHLGLSRVPVIRLGDLTPAQARAYRIADNQLTLLGGWDKSALAQEIQALSSEDFDLSLTGFDPDEIEKFFEGLEDVEAPEDFKEFDEDLETDYRCPKCGYEWSGKEK